MIQRTLQQISSLDDLTIGDVGTYLLFINGDKERPSASTDVTFFARYNGLQGGLLHFSDSVRLPFAICEYMSNSHGLLQFFEEMASTPGFVDSYAGSLPMDLFASTARLYRIVTENP